MRALRLVYEGLTALSLMAGIAIAFSPIPMVQKLWIASGFIGIVLAYIAVAEVSIQIKTGTLREFWQQFSTKTFWSKALVISCGSAALIYLFDQKAGWLVPCAIGVGIGVFAPIHGSLSGSFFYRISK